MREVSHSLAYFDEFTTGLDGFKNSSVEFFLKASCVLILFSGRAKQIHVTEEYRRIVSFVSFEGLSESPYLYLHLQNDYAGA